MLEVIDSNIFLTRGDTALLKIDIQDIDGKDFMHTTQSFKLIFTVKKYCGSQYSVIKKVLYSTNAFELEPEDTNKLPFGEYFYDVELQMNNKIFTIITPHKFILQKEVSMENDINRE